MKHIISVVQVDLVAHPYIMSCFENYIKWKLKLGKGYFSSGAVFGVRHTSRVMAGLHVATYWLFFRSKLLFLIVN